jgi:hypothetical protein
VTGGALLVALRVEELGRVRFRSFGASVDSGGVFVRHGSPLGVGTLGHKHILPHTELGSRSRADCRVGRSRQGAVLDVNLGSVHSCSLAGPPLAKNRGPPSPARQQIA